MPAGHMLLLMAANARKQDTQLFMAAECLWDRHFAAGSLIEESVSGRQRLFWRRPGQMPLTDTFPVQVTATH